MAIFKSQQGFSQIVEPKPPAPTQDELDELYELARLHRISEEEEQLRVFKSLPAEVREEILRLRLGQEVNDAIEELDAISVGCTQRHMELHAKYQLHYGHAPPCDSLEYKSSDWNTKIRLLPSFSRLKEEHVDAAVKKELIDDEG